MGAIVKKGWQQYMIQLQLHPLRTKAITAGILAGISDSVAQKLSGFQRLQLRRLLLKVVLCLRQSLGYGNLNVESDPQVIIILMRDSLGSWQLRQSLGGLILGYLCEYLVQLFGFAYGGPFGHFLHILMDKIFKGKRDTRTVAKKVLLEQLTSSPWNNILFMLYYGLVVERRPWVQVKSKLKKDYPSVQLTAWMFWPIVGWVNHQYMPLQFRVIFHSFVACCWGIFLNLRARSMMLTKG